MATMKVSHKNKSALAVTLALSLLSATACATHGKGSAGSKHYNEDRYTDYARVIKVTPVYREVQVSVPERQCWDEQVVHRKPTRHYGGYQSYTPHILGGVAGGVVGNQFGKGNGKTLLTVAGALLGGSIGRDASNRHRTHSNRDYRYTTTETRCETRNNYHTEEHQDGYRVKYRYNGRVYTTRMDHAPGRKIRVNVRVVPSQ